MVSLRMLPIRTLKSSSLRTGSFGMWMRPKWLVTPRGRMASNSGCTEVLVDGAMTPNFLRKPSESVMGGSLPQVAYGRQWRRLRLSFAYKEERRAPALPGGGRQAVLALNVSRSPPPSDMLEF